MKNGCFSRYCITFVRLFCSTSSILQSICKCCLYTYLKYFIDDYWAPPLTPTTTSRRKNQLCWLNEASKLWKIKSNIVSIEIGVKWTSAVVDQTQSCSSNSFRCKDNLNKCETHAYHFIFFAEMENFQITMYLIRIWSNCNIR